MISQEDYINTGLDFLKECGATGQYSTSLMDNGMLVVVVRNPGWSIKTMSRIYTDLNTHMLEYCRANDLDLFDKVRFFID